MKNAMRFLIIFLVVVFATSCGTSPGTKKDATRTSSFSGLEQITNPKKGRDFDVNVSPDGSRIAFCSDRTGKPHIYIKDIGSLAVSQKTFGNTSNLDPVFSPDGKHLAFTSNRGGNFDIYVINADEGGAVRQLTFTAENEVNPSWSNDGEKIVYSRWSTIEQNWQIWISYVDSGKVINLGEGYDPEWSPTENEIIFIRKSAENDKFQSLWKIDEKGNRFVEILHADDWGVWTPTWSPGGNYILFATVNKSLSHKGDIEYKYLADDLWIIKANGSQLTQLTKNKEADWSPCWAKVSNEDRIYFSSRRNRKSCLWACTPKLIEF